MKRRDVLGQSGARGAQPLSIGTPAAVNSDELAEAWAAAGPELRAEPLACAEPRPPRDTEKPWVSEALQQGQPR